MLAKGDISRKSLLWKEGFSKWIQLEKIPELKKSLGDRVFFAGEATAYSYGTVHGADQSGRRAVGQLLTLKALD